MFPRAAALTTTSQHGGSQEPQQSSGSGPVDGTKAQALGGHPLILPRADRARQARAEPGSWPLSKAKSLGSVSQREESKLSQQAIKCEACWTKISKMKCVENVEEKRNKQGGEGRSRFFFKKTQINDGTLMKKAEKNLQRD